MPSQLDKTRKEYEYLTDPRFVEYHAMPKIKEIIGNDKKILDVGCRSRFWLAYFCDGTGNQGTGRDIHPTDDPVKHENVEILTGPIDITEMHENDSTKHFDVSTMLATLEHLWVPGDRYAVENMIKHTKEKVIIMTPIYYDRPQDTDRGRGNVDTHINMFDCERFDKFLASFGYEYDHIDVQEGYSSHIGVIHVNKKMGESTSK